MTYTREADTQLFAQFADVPKPRAEQKRFCAMLA
jgi:hypothetical protein